MDTEGERVSERVTHSVRFHASVLVRGSASPASVEKLHARRTLHERTDPHVKVHCVSREPTRVLASSVHMCMHSYMCVRLELALERSTDTSGFSDTFLSIATDTSTDKQTSRQCERMSVLSRVDREHVEKAVQVRTGLWQESHWSGHSARFLAVAHAMRGRRSTSARAQVSMTSSWASSAARAATHSARRASSAKGMLQRSTFGTSARARERITSASSSLSNAWFFGSQRSPQRKLVDDCRHHASSRTRAHRQLASSGSP